MKITREQILSIPEKLEDMTFQQIAEEFGVSVGTVSNGIKRLRREGFEVTVRKGPKPLKLR